MRPCKSMQPARILLALIVPLALSASGCVRISQKAPDKRLFVLSADRGAEAASPILADSVSVEGFKISPRYEGSELVYRTSDLQYESDFYNRFFVGPEILIAEETRKWLQAAGVFRHVVDPAGPVRPGYEIDGMVTALCGDFRAAPKAIMEIQFFLLDASSASPRILLQKDYRREVLIPSADPRRLIEGFNTALREILAGFEADLREALREKIKP